MHPFTYKKENKNLKKQCDSIINSNRSWSDTELNIFLKLTIKSFAWTTILSGENIKPFLIKIKKLTTGNHHRVHIQPRRDERKSRPKMAKTEPGPLLNLKKNDIMVHQTKLIKRKKKKNIVTGRNTLNKINKRIHPH